MDGHTTKRARTSGPWHGRAAALSAVLALMMAACSPATTAPAATAAPAAPAAPAARGPDTKLTVAFSSIDVSMLPVWLAIDDGLFQNVGLTIDLQFVASSNSVSALLSNEAQMALVGGSGVLSAAVNGADLVMVGTLDPVFPYKLMVTPDIKTADDLKGKKLGVSVIGDSSDIALRLSLRKLGLDPEKDVTIVQTGNHANRTAAMFAGAIQGGVDSPPATLELEDKGFTVLVDLAATKTPAANLCVTLQRSWLAANRDEMQRFIDVWVQGSVRARTDKAHALDILARYTQSEDRRALESAYDYYATEIIPDYPFLRMENMADSVDVLAQTNPKIKELDVPGMLDSSFVQSAFDRGLAR
jgi:NitT/TauT family transport system substrate-binding protein